MALAGRQGSGHAVDAVTAAAEAAATEEALAAVAALIASEEAEAAAAQAAGAAAVEAAPAAVAGPPDATPPVVPVTRSRSGARQDVRDGWMALYEVGWELRYLRLVTGKSSYWCTRRLHPVSVGPFPFERGSGSSGGEQMLRLEIEFMVPHSERSAFSKLRTTNGGSTDAWREAVGGPTVLRRSRRPIHPRAPGGPYQRCTSRPSRTRTFVNWCRAARWKLRSATNGRASASRRPGCPPAAAASDVVTATAGTRRCGWRIGARRRPTRGGATTALYAALRAELVAFEFAFRRPPACDGRVKTAFHGAFRKFRIVVDVHLSAEAAEPPHEPPPPPTTQPTTAPVAADVPTPSPLPPSRHRRLHATSRARGRCAPSASTRCSALRRSRSSAATTSTAAASRSGWRRSAPPARRAQSVGTPPCRADSLSCSDRPSRLGATAVAARWPS